VALVLAMTSLKEVSIAELIRDRHSKDFVDWEDAVFYLHEGATREFYQISGSITVSFDIPVQNVIIGKNQAEGIHCTGREYGFLPFECF